MEIPKQVRVGRTLYQIKLIPSLPTSWHAGQVRYDAAEILVSTHAGTSNRKRTAEELTQLFWHEVVHAALHDMGRTRLCNDEDFVDALAERLTDVVQTARF